MAETAWNADLWPVLPVGAGIARERETKADDAAPGQRECRAICMPGGVCRGTRSWTFLRVGAGTAARRAAGGSLPSAFVGCRCGGPQRCERFCHSQVRITPNAGIRDEKEPPQNRGSFPSPACGGLCRPEAGVPSRPRAVVLAGGRRSLAGCAGRRPAQFSRWGLRAVPAVVVAGGRRSLAGGAITMVGVPVKPALSWQPAGGRCPLSDTPSRHSAPPLHA